MDDDLSTQLITQTKGIWKYRWSAIIVAWVIAIAGWMVVYRMPDEFQASARIHVDTGNVLKPLMQGMTVAPDMQKQLIIMTRTLISRPNVERIARMVDPDFESKTKKDQQNKVSSLMSKIILTNIGTDNLYTISYNSSDRELARNVVQSSLDIFMEENNDSDSNSTSAIRFIDEQIDVYEKKLVTQEEELKKFQQKNVGFMPQQAQGGSYYKQLGAAEEELKKTKLELREAEHARDSIKKQITGDEPVLIGMENEGISDEVDPSSIVNTEVDARITELHKQLDILSLNYTDQHPDIIATKRLIIQLQDRKVADAAKYKSSSFDPGKNYSPMLQQLNLALTDSEAKVASMRARVEEYTDRYNQLKSMSNTVPEVEAALAQLNRDYQVNKTNYERLLERRESAKIASKLGSASKLMSFKIIDPPTVPESPSGPMRDALYSMVFFAALGAGIAVAFALSQLRPSFHTQSSLREITGRPVIGSIPMIWTSKEQKERKKRLFALGLSLLSLFGLYGVLMLKMS